MGSMFDDPIEGDESDENEDPVEIDPATVAFLDQEEAAWEGERESFRRYYGFDHECTCSQDYSGGRTGLVTQCFMKLTSQALEYSAKATHDNQLLMQMVDQLILVNNDLVKMLEDLGHKDELERYFTETIDLDAAVEADLQEPESPDTESGEDEDGDDS